MRITSGFIYYFVWLMISLTVLLGLLCFKKIRHLFFKLANKLNIKEFPVYNMLFWIIFVIIAIVMFDAIATFFVSK